MDARRIDSLVVRVLERLESQGAVPAAESAPRPHAGGGPARAARVARGGPVFETVDEAAHAARAAFLDLGATSLETRDAMIARIRETIHAHAPELAEMA
ncbi:MAG: hypothetical protein KC591_11240, partial [Gemmatimonadetes bacterium]|nr:hypothetical protein [Gemmatimonadota bacterium]